MIYVITFLCACIVGLLIRLNKTRKTLHFLTRLSDDHGCNQPVRHSKEWIKQIKIYCPHCQNNKNQALREARAIVRKPL